MLQSVIAPATNRRHPKDKGMSIRSSTCFKQVGLYCSSRIADLKRNKFHLTTNNVGFLYVYAVIEGEDDLKDNFVCAEATRIPHKLEFIKEMKK